MNVSRKSLTLEKNNGLQEWEDNCRAQKASTNRCRYQPREKNENDCEDVMKTLM